MEKVKNFQSSFCFVRLGALSLVASFVLLVSSPVVSAADIPIENYVAGQMTLALHGAWSSGMALASSVPLEFGVTSYWNGTDNTDYIDYVDDTATAGFYLTMQMTDFAYSGSDQGQGPIVASNFKLIGEYSGGAAVAATKGYDDPTKGISILPNSCGGATTSTFFYHDELTNSVNNYSLQGSTTSKIVMGSSASCTNIGHLRFDRSTLVIPANSAVGSYSSTMTITMVDGAP